MYFSQNNKQFQGDIKVSSLSLPHTVWNIPRSRANKKTKSNQKIYSRDIYVVLKQPNYFA